MPRDPSALFFNTIPFGRTQLTSRGELSLGTVTRVPAWSLRLEGGYLDVLAVIAAWQQAALPCHVFEIEMRRDPAGTLLWTMVVG